MRYSFYAYEDRPARKWAEQHEGMEKAQAAIHGGEPLALVLDAMMRDAGSHNLKDPVPGHLWRVCEWLGDCPIAALIVLAAERYGRDFISPQATLLASRVKELKEPAAMLDFARYTPGLARKVQLNLREAIDTWGNDSLLYSFDLNVKLNDH